MANAMLIGCGLQHSLKGMIGSDGYNRILKVTTVFPQPVTPTAMQYLSCYHPRPKTVDIFHVILTAFGGGKIVSFEVSHFV
jgi:hypothetical protein